MSPSGNAIKRSFYEGLLSHGILVSYIVIIMDYLRKIPAWFWGSTLIGIGLCLAFIHLYHFTREDETLAIVIGVIIPFIISLIVIWVGIQLIRNPQLQKIGPWLTGWMILGMGWMTVAGTGAVLYESAEGTSLSHAYFLIFIFATYGCLPGLFTGWYDGTRHQQHKTIATHEDQLAVLSRILRHNIRNAMNVILGHAKTIQRSGSNQIADHAQEILVNGQDLMHMTEKERVLVETLVNPSKPRALNLGQVLGDVVERLQREYPDADIQVDGDLKLRIRAIPEIEQALEELIENGIVHNDEDQPQVSISVDRSGSSVSIRIADYGDTIPSEEIALISDTKTETQLNHGSGIGLKLANTIISQSGGSLEFDSSKQVGTQVIVTLHQAG